MYNKSVICWPVPFFPGFPSFMDYPRMFFACVWHLRTSLHKYIFRLIFFSYVFIVPPSVFLTQLVLFSLHWFLYAAHERPHEQNLFGIVQGGLDPVLRWILTYGVIFLLFFFWLTYVSINIHIFFTNHFMS